MRPEARDRAHLWDMREFARASRKLVQRVSFARLERDSMRKLALERALELLGESAHRVSDATRKEHPAIDWHALIGQRNVLAHEYGDIDHRLLYDHARSKAPALLAELDRILGEP
jgi:uncharacterized protein with HEPN domain